MLYWKSCRFCEATPDRAIIPSALTRGFVFLLPVYSGDLFAKRERVPESLEAHWP